MTVHDFVGIKKKFYHFRKDTDNANHDYVRNNSGIDLAITIKKAGDNPPTSISFLNI